MRRGLAAIALLATISAGCAGDAAERAALAPVTKLIESFDPERSPDGSFALLNALVTEEPQLSARAAASLIEDERGHTRFAATYVLGITADEPDELDALALVLDDPAPYLRAIAAGALAGAGREAALPVLAALVEEEEEIPFSDQAISRLALETLRHYTGQDLDSVSAWEAWLAKTGPLRWDSTAGRYEP